MTRGQWRALDELCRLGPATLPRATAMALVGRGLAEVVGQSYASDYRCHVAATDYGRKVVWKGRDAMPKYRVYGSVVGSKYLGEYEASSKEEAEQMALGENGGVSLCHQCASECEDGTVEECTVELVAEEPKPKAKRRR